MNRLKDWKLDSILSLNLIKFLGTHGNLLKDLPIVASRASNLSIVGCRLQKRNVQWES